MLIMPAMMVMMMMMGSYCPSGTTNLSESECIQHSSLSFRMLWCVRAFSVSRWSLFSDASNGPPGGHTNQQLNRASRQRLARRRPLLIGTDRGNYSKVAINLIDSTERTLMVNRHVALLGHTASLYWNVFV